MHCAQLFFVLIFYACTDLCILSMSHLKLGVGPGVENIIN
uniref:Uncharacterized protein n=1 Tax=Anguilla anguilla TaxID=7936 RepID=A0A0E9Q9D5_ANGAN